MRIAAIDMGTNSFHLLAVEAHPDGTFVPLIREKEMLRLGDAVSRDGRIGERLMDDAVAAMRRFGAMAEGIGCDEVIACATSAVREADNGSELVDRILAETGIRPRVISGRDEARLIFAAVRASVLLDPAPALCFDLGGGSLEVMVGDRAGLLWSTSLKLGVARLTAELIDSDPPSEHDQRRLRDRITAALAPVADVAADLGPKTAVGTSGTFCDLARMVAAASNGADHVSINQLCITRQDFLAVHEEIVSTPAQERLRMSGLDARRVDLIPAGSMVLAVAMELFGFDEFTVSEWALREGIVLDAIGHHDPADWTGDPRAMRRASVISLARRCGWDEAHGERVAQLAGDLFDRTLPLHRLSGEDRELL
ncbi:MAG: Ppx/GppA family phosphatase, partial [Acidimicrobiia bacterium]|nr:Ppx/GppA family phosphatase [Acidimicrobiia bacterium]